MPEIYRSMCSEKSFFKCTIQLSACLARLRRATAQSWLRPGRHRGRCLVPPNPGRTVRIVPTCSDLCPVNSGLENKTIEYYHENDSKIYAGGPSCRLHCHFNRVGTGPG